MSPERSRLNNTVRPDELSALLRRLRQDARLTGIEAARAAGLSQPKISRLETGKQVPTAAEVQALCRVYGASAAIRQQLLDVAHDMREEQVSARVMLQRGAYRMQERIGRIEAASRLLRTFHPAVVIGLVQTPGYVRALIGNSLPDDELERIVTARGERQRLLDTDREFVLIMTEGALRWHVGSPAVMIAQLQHLAEITRRSNVRVGVIPWTKPVRAGALHGFHLYDRRAAIVGTETATAIITDTRDIADYETCFATYEALAVFDADARQVLDRLSDEYRTLDRS
ncbi:MAG: helix-turn-helix domain-containing protein [Pseudonocardiales bacterium]